MKLGHLLAACVLAAACGGMGADGNGPYCGDGVRQAGEQCDDGSSNGMPGDPCTATCMNAGGACGDGLVETGEECDNGSDRNGPPPAPCSATCTFNDPELAVTWQIVDLDGTPGACPGWPANAMDPPPSTSSIRLAAISAQSTTAACSPVDFSACIVATFDCAAGSGSVRLPPAMYQLYLQPVQAIDEYVAASASADLTAGSGSASFGAQGDLRQGTKLLVTWTLAAPATCQSMEVDVSSSDDLGRVTSFQPTPEPCTATGTDTIGPYLPGTYTVTLRQTTVGGTTLISPQQTATVTQSNAHPVTVATLAFP